MTCARLLFNGPSPEGSGALGVYTSAHINMCLCLFAFVTVTLTCLLSRLLAALSRCNECEPGHDTSAMHYLANGSVAGVGVLVLRLASRWAKAVLLTSAVTSSASFSSPCFPSLRGQRDCSRLDKELLGVSRPPKFTWLAAAHILVHWFHRF